MLHQDFYTGEPTTLGSPISSAEQEAASMASFGKYDYNSGSRNLFPQPMFNQQTNQNFQRQTIGIGAPYFNNNQFNQYYNGYGNFSPYGNVMPNRQMFNQQFYQPPQPTTYHIPGFNPSGSEFLPETGWEDQLNDLQMEYWIAKQEVDVANEMKMQQSVYGGNQWGFNYYGMPYYNPYMYNSLDSEFSQKINKIKDKARESRVQLNMQLLKLSHNILGDEVSDEEIEKRCKGFDIPIPPTTFQDNQNYYQQVRLSNMVEVSNAKFYSDARAKRQRELDALIPPNSNMKEAFDGLGLLAAELDLEEEKHRRKDLGQNYSSGNNVYKYYVRKKAKERYAAENGTSQPQNQFNNAFGNQLVNQFPTLSQNATIADDGTLNVSLSLPVNVGSHAGETYTIANANEAEYEKKREQFGKFLGSIKTNGEPYLEDLKRRKYEEYVPI